jgi:hypothetical protein
MPLTLAGLRFPRERVLLPRTKLAYVHLRNLLTDAKRDRSARVFGYVAIWLPEELVLLYLQEGELVNATVTTDGRSFSAVPIGEAVNRVPTEPELGEICFNEADDEQLACMFQAQTSAAEPWPPELQAADSQSLFPYLMATTFDGVVRVIVDGAVNFLVLRNGLVERAFLVDTAAGALDERVQRLFTSDGRRARPLVERWPVPQPLPVQAQPALIQAYRDLLTGLISELVSAGSASATTIAESARHLLLDQHPALKAFAATGRLIRDPVADTAELTAAVAAWVAEIMWGAAADSSATPEAMLQTVTRERRHMLQSAGFFDALPWKVEW